MSLLTIPFNPILRPVLLVKLGNIWMAIFGQYFLSVVVKISTKYCLGTSKIKNHHRYYFCYHKYFFVLYSAPARDGTANTALSPSCRRRCQAGRRCQCCALAKPIISWSQSGRSSFCLMRRDCPAILHAFAWGEVPFAPSPKDRSPTESSLSEPLDEW